MLSRVHVVVALETYLNHNYPKSYTFLRYKRCKQILILFLFRGKILPTTTTTTTTTSPIVGLLILYIYFIDPGDIKQQTESLFYHHQRHLFLRSRPLDLFRFGISSLPWFPLCPVVECQLRKPFVVYLFDFHRFQLTPFILILSVIQII